MDIKSSKIKNEGVILLAHASRIYVVYNGVCSLCNIQQQLVLLASCQQHQPPFYEISFCYAVGVVFDLLIVYPHTTTLHPKHLIIFQSNPL